MNSYVYIASPYSHPNKKIMQDRYEAVMKYAAKCTKNGEIVYSPIAHNHAMALHENLPHSWDFWSHIDFAFLKHAESLRVFCLDGWSESTGVKGEIEFAHKNGIIVYYYYPNVKSKKKENIQ